MPLFTREQAKRVGVPNVVAIEEVLAGIRLALEQNQLTNNGPRIKEFEAALASYLGTKEFITVNNATNGLMAVAKALDLGVDPAKRHIILPSFTFCATVNAMVWMGLIPVFCDIDPNTYQLDRDQVRKLISPNVCAILGVHVYGLTADLDALQEIATGAGIPLFFDAAHAFGASFKSKKIGNYGCCEVFSFHATKAFNTFEGGGVATNDSRLADRLRKLNNFGFVGYDNIGDIGINSKMSEINAIQGLVMLKHYNSIVEHNKRNYDVYRGILGATRNIKFLDHQEGSNFHYIVIELESPELRDRLVDTMLEHNVTLRKYFSPGVHKMTPYQAGFKSVELPNTDFAADRVICLPSGLHVSDADAHRIAIAINEILEQKIVT